MVVSADRVFQRLRMRQMALIVALDQHRSLRRAAADLGMTQSAASKALAEIEAVIGSELFERSSAGLIPNELGECLIRYAWLMRADVASLCQEIGNIQAGRARRLSIGTIMGAIPVLLSEAVTKLRAEMGNLSIQIVEDTSAALLEGLDQGRLDLAIGRATVSPDPGLYHFEPLRDEPLALVVGASHRLAGAEAVALPDLAGCGWVVYPSQMPLRAMLERTLSNAGMAMPGEVIETASTFATISLLVRDPGLVALLPRDVCQLFQASGLIRALPLPLTDANPAYGLLTRANAVLTGPAKRLREILRDTALSEV